MNRPNLQHPSAALIGGAKVSLFVLSLLPLAWIIASALTDSLGANPIEKIARTTGWWTLAFLILSLTVTPLRKLSGRPWLGRFRRMLGLFTFFYGSQHFLTYLVLDQFFAWGEILGDVAKRPYITVGFSAFVLMVPLAATSTDGMIRRLGGKAWRRLHRLVYAIAVSGVIHYWWLVKKDITEPAVFGAIVALLLLYRVLSAMGPAGRRKVVAKWLRIAGGNWAARESA